MSGKAQAVRQPIIDAMLEEGRSRKDVYTFLNVSKSWLSRCISGEIDPPASKALRMAFLLNRPVEELFGDLLVMGIRSGRGRRPQGGRKAG